MKTEGYLDNLLQLKIQALRGKSMHARSKLQTFEEFLGPRVSAQSESFKWWPKITCLLQKATRAEIRTGKKSTITGKGDSYFLRQGGRAYTGPPGSRQGLGGGCVGLLGVTQPAEPLHGPGFCLQAAAPAERVQGWSRRWSRPGRRSLPHPHSGRQWASLGLIQHEPTQSALTLTKEQYTRLQLCILPLHFPFCQGFHLR